MKRLILASVSPRRKVLLASMGLEFEVVPSRFDEWLDDAKTPQDMALELGFGKADTVAKDYPEAYVIGGDAIVVLNGKQLAKPADPAEARAMLQSLSGRTHQVVTSVVLVCLDDKVREGEATTVDVTFQDIPKNVIDAYVATGDPYDKAGGYARQHPLLSPLVTMHGDPHAVTGLSTRVLRTLLEKHGIPVPFNEEKTQELFIQAGLSGQRILT
jgi:septum formation protein